MGCGTKCLKIFLVAVNIIFFLAGAAILGVGLWLRFDSSLVNFNNGVGLESFQQAIWTSAYILIAFGAFTFIVGFCGCCGAIKDSKCLLGIYIILVVIVLGAEIAGGVYGYVKRDSLIETFKATATEYLKDDYNQTSPSGLAWNIVMIEFKCCGIEGPDDFKYSLLQNTTQLNVPLACCTQKSTVTAETQWKPDPVDATKCQNSNLQTDSNYRQNTGCYRKLETWITSKAAILLGVAGGIAGFELLVILAGICYCCNMDKDD